MTDPDPGFQWFIGLLVIGAVLFLAAFADLVLRYTHEVTMFLVALVAVAVVPYAVGWVVVRLFNIEVPEQ